MRRRRIFLWTQAALCAVAAVLLAAAVAGAYREGLALRAAGDASAWLFTREGMARRLAPLIPLAVGTAVLALIGIALGIRDERRDAPVKGARVAPGPMSAQAREGKRLNALRAALALLAVALIVHGCLNGSMRDVFAKAVNICTECIGLG